MPGRPFSNVFSAKDFIGKLNSFGNIMAVVDKPHNFYIQTAHNTGLLSLVALLFLFIIYLIRVSGYMAVQNQIVFFKEQVSLLPVLYWVI